MTGQEAFKLFSEDPSLADAYHEGFRAQAAKWPKNPLDEVIRASLRVECVNRCFVFLRFSTSLFCIVGWGEVG